MIPEVPYMHKYVPIGVLEKMSDDQNGTIPK